MEVNGDNTTDLSEIPITERFSLKDKNYFITGGGRGIGFACAKAIAQLGGGVAIVDALPEPVDEFHTLAKRYGVKTSYVQTDVTNQKSFEDAFEASVKNVGQLHGGLMAAGICIEEKMIDATWEVSQKIFNVNVMGTFWGTKLLAKHLVDTNTPGSIVLIASLAAQGVNIPVQYLSSYNASKAAVKGLVGPLSVELGKHGIRVNSISPGIILTEMTKKLSAENPATFNWYTAATPIGRLGIPQDLTPTVCYLLSDAGSFSTGADHLITGGIHAGRTDPLDISRYH